MLCWRGGQCGSVAVVLLLLLLAGRWWEAVGAWVVVGGGVDVWMRGCVDAWMRGCVAVRDGPELVFSPPSPPHVSTTARAASTHACYVQTHGCVGGNLGNLHLAKNSAAGN